MNRETLEILLDDEAMEAIAEAMDDISNGDIIPLEEDDEQV